MEFSKYEGLGNDFVVLVDVPITAAQVSLLCDRHRGVGADGVLVLGTQSAGPYMRVLNADGSIPEMCGNGLRCAALHLARTGLVDGSEFVIDTDAGPHRCMVRAGEVQVAMRPPSFEPVDVPVAAEQPVLDAKWQLGDRALRVSAVSVGNPHVVTFDDVGDARSVLGPLLGADARLPQGANAGFAVLRDNGLHLHVFERGAGWTQACGTGACAAVSVAVETGRARRGVPMAVHLPGGTLQITVGAPGDPIEMRGPARHVFDGTARLE